MITADSSDATLVAEPHIARLGDLIDDLYNDSGRAWLAIAEGRLLGPPITFNTVSRELGGYWPPGLHVLHAGAGCGKSAFAIQSASAAAAQHCAVIYISCEMDALEVFRRVIARETSTYKGRLAPGQLDPSVVLTLARRTAAANPGFVVVDATSAPVPITLIRDIAEDLKAKLMTEHVFVVVDSVHAWSQSLAGESVSEYEIISSAVSQLLSLTSYLHCPVLAIAERNRMAMREGGLSAGAGSRKLEYTPATVIELSRSPDEVEDGNGEVVVELRFAKNRNGRVGVTVPLRFNGALQAFREGEAQDVIPLDRQRRRRA